eukprot:TRINITY_DN62_c0_g1_i1.p1 TRINITY_DN62_c0_g1~~TRINITY_DN62_c0_g1_i1.p1  ORF type:complete len:365 (+),score=58.08 TRINITY_DN62_c0_g1_i1:85-1179(+)
MSSVWDENTQTFHGGQEWRALQNFHCDFSVTTNGLGTPKKALEAAVRALKDIEHYPAADFEPAKSLLAKWLSKDEELNDRLILGNGASELIDLITRIAPPGPFRPGPFVVHGNPVQYREYERAAKANDRKILHPDDKEKEAITAIVNPSNPTGDYFPLEKLKAFIEERCSEGSFVMVDESMLPWEGPRWTDQSLISAKDWISSMYSTKNISIWIVHSWTKIWSCPGLRIGSAITPTKSHKNTIKQKQVPWSLNTCALAFLTEVVKDEEFMKQTWETNRTWRDRMLKKLKKNHPNWQLNGVEFASWIWIDLGNENTAQRAVSSAKLAGVPVRSGKSGYRCDTCLRVGIREPRFQDILFDAWKTLE